MASMRWWRANAVTLHVSLKTWWRHQMETFSALLAICAGNSPVPGECPIQRPMTRSFDVFIDLRPNKRLSKHWWGWWFKTPSGPLWRHCHGCDVSVDNNDPPFQNAHACNVQRHRLSVTVSSCQQHAIVARPMSINWGGNGDEYRNFSKQLNCYPIPCKHEFFKVHTSKSSDVIMSAMVSQNTGIFVVHSTVYSGANQRKRQSSASLAFVTRIHRWPVNSPHKGPVTRKMFPFDDVIMQFIILDSRTENHRNRCPLYSFSSIKILGSSLQNMSCLYSSFCDVTALFI